MDAVKANKKSTSLRLNASLYNYIEKEAKRQNRSVNNFIETTLYDAVGYHEPNERLKKTIEESIAEMDSLKRYSSAEELFKDLENEL
ncbi:MAG: hypothetical protein QM564_08375 [Bergeyella sp.]